VSIADYTVKSGAAIRNGSIRYPNWLAEGSVTEDYVEGLRKRTGLSRLSIVIERSDAQNTEPETGNPPVSGTCIYRLVVVGQTKEIRRLFVCGG
jgi:hypothetical protein